LGVRRRPLGRRVRIEQRFEGLFGIFRADRLALQRQHVARRELQQFKFHPLVVQLAQQQKHQRQ